MDFAGPFQGMFLVTVDAFSKWPHVVPMASTTVSKTISALEQMFSLYGIPGHVVTDNGPQFASGDFAVFLNSQGVCHMRSAPYHPATNGLAEHFVQSLKQGSRLVCHPSCHCLLDYTISCSPVAAQYTLPQE